MRRLQWLVAIPIASVLLVTAGTFAYIHFLNGDNPAPLTLAGAATSGTAAQLDGSWTATSGSQAGYRVKEVLFGQNTEAVGRTTGVTGSLAISGTTVSAAQVTVDMTTVASDEGRRDNQFRGRIMDVADYPTATFKLTKPIDLGTLPADGRQVTVPASGALTLRGTTKTVTVNLAARRNGEHLEVNGTIPVVFADYGIPNPSFGPASTEDHGQVEFLVVFAR
jgi:polyisoprenoid-binding protein YceI